MQLSPYRACRPCCQRTSNSPSPVHISQRRRSDWSLYRALQRAPFSPVGPAGCPAGSCRETRQGHAALWAGVLCAGSESEPEGRQGTSIDGFSRVAATSRAPSLKRRQPGRSGQFSSQFIQKSSAFPLTGSFPSAAWLQHSPCPSFDSSTIASHILPW